MKKYYSIWIAMLALICSSASAQPLVKQQEVLLLNTNLRHSQPTVLERVVLQHSGGTIIVRFDGCCHADSGDRIAVAASYAPSYSSNDGHVEVQVANNATHSRSFCHTREYTMPAGTDTFYALAQNVIDTGGSGVASVFGDLTVEFFPATGVPYSTIAWSGDLSSGQRRMDSVSVPSAPLGKVYVHMDGQVSSDPGDRIVFTANYAPSWLVDAGSVAFMAYNAAQKISPFTHSRVFNVTHNPNTYYAMGANVVDQGGSGIATANGSLTAEFFPTAGGATIDKTDVLGQGLNVRGAPLAIDSVTISVPANGNALVQFDGYIVSTEGDRIILEANDTPALSFSKGTLDVQAYSHNDAFNVFSQSRLFAVVPGSHTFYAVAQNVGAQSGAGTVSIAANFSVKYYPDVNTGINDVSAATFLMYPNPAQDRINIVLPNASASQQIEITDMMGRSLLSTISSSDEVQINVSSLPAGIYLVRCGSAVQRIVKQ